MEKDKLKVVSIDDAPVGPYVMDVVDILSGAIENKNVENVAIAIIHKDGSVSHSIANYSYEYNMIGALEDMKHRILTHMMEREND